jgi:hypothetical protein
MVALWHTHMAVIELPLDEDVRLPLPVIVNFRKLPDMALPAGYYANASAFPTVLRRMHHGGCPRLVCAPLHAVPNQLHPCRHHQEPPSTRAVSHRRAGHQGGVSERAIPNTKKDQLQ